MDFDLTPEVNFDFDRVSLSPIDGPLKRLLEVDPDEAKAKTQTLEATWWLFDKEPEMDDLMEQAGESLKEMTDRVGVAPFRDTEGNQRLMLARFEIPKYGEKFQFPDAVAKQENALAFIDFLGGYPLECCEMLVLIGQYSSKQVASLPGDGGAAPPVPDNFFAGYDPAAIVLNYLYLVPDSVDWMANNLEGEPEPSQLHWWHRWAPSGLEEAKFPVPGEFLSLGVRFMPDKPWGEQDTSPFLYSGNWVDTVFYTCGFINDIIPPTDTTPYPVYKVQWRKEEIMARPTDFAEYQVGDRVTILKDVSVEKTSQLWKDEDMMKYGDMWAIAPISFYEAGQ